MAKACCFPSAVIAWALVKGKKKNTKRGVKGGERKEQSSTKIQLSLPNYCKARYGNKTLCDIVNKIISTIKISHKTSSFNYFIIEKKDSYSRTT